MSEDHDALALPLGIQHVGKVAAPCTQNAAMGPEGLPVHHEEHVTVDALIQKPGGGRRGVDREQVEEGSGECLSSVSPFQSLISCRKALSPLQATPITDPLGKGHQMPHAPSHRCRNSS